MSLAAAYQRFLEHPATLSLTPQASLNYITSLVTVNEAETIIRHLATQAKQIRKKAEKSLFSVESKNGLCVEIDTTIEFISGGGAYVPGLDDNLLANHVVNIPIVHIVQFSADQKIEQIRLHWDQASMLKQVEVIGSRARNWPVRDGKDQVHAIISSINNTSKPNAEEMLSPPRSRPGTSSGIDPHERLFAPRDDDAALTPRRKSYGPVVDPVERLFSPKEEKSDPVAILHPGVAPRVSAKPPPREWQELFGDGQSAAARAVTNTGSPSTSPSKGNAAKALSNKNYQPIRVFDQNTASLATKDPKPSDLDSRKYSHFEFGDGETSKPAAAPEAASLGNNRGGAYGSQWDFGDFATPQKAKSKVNEGYLKAFNATSLKDDDAQQTSGSPKYRNTVHQPRPDALTHFVFSDAPSPAVANGQKLPLSTISTNGQRKNFDNHFNIGDNRNDDINNNNSSSDANSNGGRGGNGNGAATKEHTHNNNNTTETRHQKTLNTHWGFGSEQQQQQHSPTRKENNVVRAAGYKTAGDGMGGRKGGGATGGAWLYGELEPEPEEAEKGRTNKAARLPGPQKAATEKGFWDF